MIPNSLPSVDFLVRITGDRYNPTGVITPMTDNAFEFVHESGMEFVSYDITDSNGYCFDRRTLDEIVDHIEGTELSIAMYDPEFGIAFLEPV